MFHRHLGLSLVVVVITLAGCASSPTPHESQTEAIHSVLDDFHEAAARADESRYFAHLSDDSVFLGTDGTERWGRDAFQKFAHPHFASGKGWTFKPRDRNIAVSADGRTAWFDEMLDSASYGECRGTGVLQKRDSVWKIEQYNLSIPMPNDLADDLVATIRAKKRGP